MIEGTQTARGVAVIGTELIVHLKDGRTFSAPLSQFPRLLNATPEQRSNFELLGGGEGIHWPDADEDLSVAGLLQVSKLIARDLRIDPELPRQAIIVLALGFATASCLGPVLAACGAGVAFMGLILTLYASLPLAATWALCVGYAFWKYGKQGWPTILGAPLVCWPLVILAQISYACSHTGCF